MIIKRNADGPQSTSNSMRLSNYMNKDGRRSINVI